MFWVIEFSDKAKTKSKHVIVLKFRPPDYIVKSLKSMKATKRKYSMIENFRI